MQTDSEFRFSHTPIDVQKYHRQQYEIERGRIIQKMIPEGQQRPALDVACGPGYFSRILADKDWETTIIDTDRQNLDMAKKFASEAHLEDASSFLSKARSNYFDFVLALEIIEHMPKNHGEKLLHNIRRVLKPNGTLIISTPNRFSLKGLKGYYWGEKLRGRKWQAWDRTHVHIYSTGELVRLLKKCQWSVRRITGFWYEGTFPLIGEVRLPFLTSTHCPFNRMGFNTIAECQKKDSVGRS